MLWRLTGWRSCCRLPWLAWLMLSRFGMLGVVYAQSPSSCCCQWKSYRLPTGHSVHMLPCRTQQRPCGFLCRGACRRSDPQMSEGHMLVSILNPAGSSNRSPCVYRQEPLLEKLQQYTPVLSIRSPWVLMQVDGAGQAGLLLAQGSAARQTAETGLNERSSRSHSCLCIRVSGTCKLTGEALLQSQSAPGHICRAMAQYPPGRACHPLCALRFCSTVACILAVLWYYLQISWCCAPRVASLHR